MKHLNINDVKTAIRVNRIKSVATVAATGTALLIDRAAIKMNTECMGKSLSRAVTFYREGRKAAAVMNVIAAVEMVVVSAAQIAAGMYVIDAAADYLGQLDAECEGLSAGLAARESKDPDIDVQI